MYWFRVGARDAGKVRARARIRIRARVRIRIRFRFRLRDGVRIIGLG